MIAAKKDKRDARRRDADRKYVKAVEKTAIINYNKKNGE